MAKSPDLYTPGADTRPTHLLRAPGDRKVMCGIDVVRSDATPFMWVAHLAERRKSYAAHDLELILCPECEHVDRTDNPRRYL